MHASGKKVMSNEKSHVSTFCWHELMTRDVEKAKAFYSALLGWTSEDFDMSAMTYTLFKKDDKTVAGLLRTPKSLESKMSPRWLSYIYVENLDNIIENIKSLGGSIVVPITSVQDTGRFAIIKDPTGASIGFWQSLKP
jgi:predicted enzyme related to lactoylglutathione lyase